MKIVFKASGWLIPATLIYYYYGNLNFAASDSIED